MEPLISIVDDDEPVRESLRRMLTAHGLATAVFASGRQLLASDQLPETSCLIADVKMPEMSGLALHHRLMAAGHRIPTILITGGPTTSGRNQPSRRGFCRMSQNPSARKHCSIMFVWRCSGASPGAAARRRHRPPPRQKAQRRPAI
ncbi:MAG: response regulator [Alphaproteobacteria bacterium]|nr:response regulator [Alphaproteobacteria bacterium]